MDRIYKDRFDMSDYLIHFTRNNNGKSAFENLKEIIQSGHIKAGWAKRNAKRTIFGKFPAVCFTEMPIYSLLKYAENREEFTKIDFYGIAISKKFMFDKGARNVIYGTTNESEHEEKRGDEWFSKYLPEEEQYRYMLTGIKVPNDWTHEREWRWINFLKHSNGDYFPIWKIDTPVEDSGVIYGDVYFRQSDNIYIIVRTSGEAVELKKIFKEMDNNQVYNIWNIDKTYVIALEEIPEPHNYESLSFQNAKFHESAISMKP